MKKVVDKNILGMYVSFFLIIFSFLYLTRFFNKLVLTVEEKPYIHID